MVKLPAQRAASHSFGYARHTDLERACQLATLCVELPLRPPPAVPEVGRLEFVVLDARGDLVATAVGLRVDAYVSHTAIAHQVQHARDSKRGRTNC